MSDQPADFCFAHNPLLVEVETSPGSREFQVDPRAHVQKLVLGSNQIPSQAVVQVYAGPIETTPPGVEPALEPGDVLSGADRYGFGPFIGPDQEVRICRDVLTGKEPGLRVLLAGYCRNPRYDERGGSPSDRGVTLIVRSMLETLSMEPPCQIYGRWMRTAAAQDLLDEELGRLSEDPHGGDESTTLVPSLLCVFNAHGNPNRAASPITVTIGETDHSIHVFAADGDPDAVMWTYAQALRYLLWFQMNEGQWWGYGNGFTATDACAALSADDRPSPPIDEESAFLFAMLGEPRDLNVQAMNLPEALNALADASQVRFAMRTESDPAATPGSYLDFVARGCGPAKTLSKQATLDTRGLSASDVLAANTVKDLSIQAVFEDVITWPIFLGDIERFEVTVELLPGWIPDMNLDDVTDVNAALTYAEAHWDLDAEEIQDDAWFRRYHKGGSWFEHYYDVGRRWVLNETGRYFQTGYERTTGPFAETAEVNPYRPWEPSTAAIKEWQRDEDRPVEAGEWSRTPRPFQPCFSADRHHRSLGIYVEFSFNSGTTWRHIPEVRILNLGDEAGIYIDTDDLTTIVLPGDDPEDPATTHFWKAILNNTARVRVTAVIDGERRVRPTLDAATFNPAITFETSKIFDLSAQYHSNRRDAANSIFGPTGERACEFETLDTINDWLRIQRMAEGILDILASRQNVFAAAIPWLTTDYEVLDSVTEIAGLGIELLTHGPGRAPRRTDIVAIEYVGSYTRLIFEDPRMLRELEF